VATTRFGKLAFLLCGDLFDDSIVRRVRDLRPDYLLYPLARSFDGDPSDQGRWEREEEPAYAERVASIGCPTLLVNYLDDPATPNPLDGPFFGGAVAFVGSGRVCKRWLLDQPGILYVGF